jgi:hypothetical protein
MGSMLAIQLLSGLASGSLILVFRLGKELFSEAHGLVTAAFLAVNAFLIEYSKRSGSSKFHFVKDAYRYILQVLRMVMYFNPLKVLMPPALWLVGIGGAKVIYDVITEPALRVATNTILILLTGLIIGSMALLADLIVRSRAG